MIVGFWTIVGGSAIILVLDDDILKPDDVRFDADTSLLRMVRDPPTAWVVVMSCDDRFYVDYVETLSVTGSSFSF